MRDSISADDKLVLSKALDTINLAQKRNSPCYYGFLNEHESQLIKDNIHLPDDCIFWGGYDEAQRVFFAANVYDKESFPFTAVKFSYKKEYKLNHRDFLGCLMSLGIERSTVGDILVNDSKTVVFVKNDVVDYVLSSITKIGKVGVNVELQDINEIEYKNEYDVFNLTVASNRLDVFVSAVCSLSREKAQRLIKSDMVAVNHSTENNVSRFIKTFDVITIRKYGKFIFTDENGLTKKGRLKITVKHFR